MQLKRIGNAASPISLVPMIDVMLILLVFFMVTSSYLNLDMIPMVETSSEQPQVTASDAEGTTLLIRLGADGVPYIRGTAHSPTSLARLLRDEVAANPLTNLILLPSNAATTQHLVSAMDTATLAGVTRLRIIRLEPRK